MVEEVLRIEGDVDFHTGDIEFVGDVRIDGDVRAGFAVNARGSVFVDGVVEDAVIKATRGVVVRGGFVGQGEGRIEAREDVVIGYVRNQTVVARRNLMIAGEAVNAVLCAGFAIRMDYPRSGIIGGQAVARDGIAVSSLGGLSETATSVIAGVDFMAELKLERIEEEIARLTERRDGLAERFRRAGVRAASRERDELRLAEEGLADLQSRRKALREGLYVVDAQVRVGGEVYPNVMIVIAQCSTVIRDALRQVLFFVKDGEVRHQALSGKSG